MKTIASQTDAKSMIYRALFAWLAIAGVAFSADPALLITKSGYWLIPISDSGDAGTPIRITQVMTIGETPAPPDPEPPVVTVPQSPIDAEIVDYARLAAKKVARHQDAQVLALVYDQMEDHLRRGDLTAEQTFKVVVKATDAVLGDQGTGTVGLWKDWRNEMSALTQVLTQEGKLTDPKDVGTYLQSVCIGLQASVPESEPALALGDGVAVKARCDAIIKEFKTGTTP